MSKREEFEPTTIKELLEESGDPKTEIRIFSSDGEWCVLSVYSDDAYCVLDIQRVE